MKRIALATLLTRPADTTAYASGDLVANSTTAGSVVPLQITLAVVKDKPFKIGRVGIQKSGTGVTNASFRAHFYSTLPTVTNGDNGAWASPKVGYLGSVDVTVDKAHSDGATGYGSPTIGAEIIAKPATGAKFCWILLEARGAYTPASAETFQVRVEDEADEH